MSCRLRLGLAQAELGGTDVAPRHTRSHHSDLLQDPTNLAALRRFLTETDPAFDASRVTDDELAALVAEQLRGGLLHLRPLPDPPRPLGALFRNPGDLGEPEDLSDLAERHFVEFVFVDDNAEPVQERGYLFTDADGVTTRGRLDANGKVRHDDVEVGSYAVELQEVERVQWGPGPDQPGKEVSVFGRVAGFADGTAVEILIYVELCEGPGQEIATLQGELVEGGVALSWKPPPDSPGPFVAELRVEASVWGKTDEALRIEPETVTGIGCDGAALWIATRGVADGAAATFDVYRTDPLGDELVETLSDLVVAGQRVETPWAPPTVDEPGTPEFYFRATVEATATLERVSALFTMPAPASD